MVVSLDPRGSLGERLDPAYCFSTSPSAINHVHLQTGPSPHPYPHLHPTPEVASKPNALSKPTQSVAKTHRCHYSACTAPSQPAFPVTSKKHGITLPTNRCKGYTADFSFHKCIDNRKLDLELDRAPLRRWRLIYRREPVMMLERLCGSSEVVG